MFRKIVFTILFLSQITFSQTEKDDYQLYKLILSEKLELGITDKIDSILLVDKFEKKTYQDYNQFEFNSDSITSSDINFLLINTHNDTTFIKRLIKEPQLKEVIIGLTSNLENNKQIKTGNLEKPNIKIKSINSSQFYSFFGKNYQKKKYWLRIKKKYGTNNILELSRINYRGDLASVYYSVHCGNLCGTGNIIVFEKKKGKWQILTEINLWMS